MTVAINIKQRIPKAILEDLFFNFLRQIKNANCKMKLATLSQAKNI
ncbi:Gluconokinase [Lactococcus cremoris]|nr:Gluconokinase [Lactococcus cremoris]